MKRRIAFVASLLVALGTACSDRPTSPTSNDGTASRSAALPALDLDGQVQSLLTTVFDKGHQTAALARWEDVKRQLAHSQHETVKGKDQPAQAARSQFVELVRWIQGKTSEMTPPAGETQAHVAARIVLYMSLYVYSGPTTSVPTVSAASDVTLGIVTPDEPATIQTPTQHAGTSFPAGAVDEPTVVVVAQTSTSYPANCTGPLETHLCQYPQFYRFNVFPDVRLNHPATVAVCHVNSGPNRNPREGIHDRFRLAHDKPSDPADYVDGGTIVDNVEVLPLMFALTLIDCTQGDSYSTPATAPNQVGLLDRGLQHLDRFAAAIGRMITPRSAYAIDLGGGGLVDLFSNFNVVDPVGKPDLGVAPGFTLGSTEYTVGDPVTVNAWTITNTGDATAGSFASAIYIASDTGLTSGAIPLGSAITTPELVMGASSTVTQQTVTLPSSLEPGTYFIGTLIDNASVVSESDEANNYVSVRITIGLDPRNAIATGDSHTCGLNAVGVAYCWGLNAKGQLGNGTVVSSSTPVPVANSAEGALRFVQIAAQTSVTCGVTRDHTAYCWGADTSGQLGNGTTANSSIPVAVSGGLTFKSVNPGGSSVCGLTTGGATYCWGNNRSGRLAIGDTVAIHTTPSAVVGAPTFESITSGLFGTCGLTASGTAYCWGDNADFSFGVGNNRGVLRVPTAVAGNLTFTDLQQGAAWGCGLAGAWYCWGTSFFGGLAMGTTETTSIFTPTPIVTPVAFASVIPGTGNDVFSPSCGLTAAGAAYCWGANHNNGLGTAASLSSCTFSTQTFGCIATPVAVVGGRSYTALRIGDEHVCAITTTHEFVCWGWNSVGQLGSATALGASTGVPTVVSGGLRAP